MAWNNSSQGDVATTFNSSLFRLISLNKIIDDCNEYSKLSYMNGYNLEYLKLWKTTLWSFYREIEAKLKDPERKRVNDLFNHGKEIGRIMIPKMTPEGKETFLNEHKFNKHYQLLSLIESRLRLLADAKGMLMTNKEQMEDFMFEDE